MFLPRDYCGGVTRCRDFLLGFSDLPIAEAHFSSHDVLPFFGGNRYYITARLRRKANSLSEVSLSACD
jgi:hypothetical protein